MKQLSYQKELNKSRLKHFLFNDKKCFFVWFTYLSMKRKGSVRMNTHKQAASYLNIAIKHRSSDVFILPRNGEYIIQDQRGNGLMDLGMLPASIGTQLIAYFKFHANMAITEKRRPQLGSMQYRYKNTVINLRLSTVGNYLNEESLVIRLIYPIALIKQEFLFKEQEDYLLEWQERRGLILFAGPTGSGKTTSIYHLTKRICQHKLVLTIEDPVEVTEPSFLQLQVNDDAQMSYDDLIKVALRHRPDIFIIGEIRDAETASAAVQAALSGHLVYSTIHAQSALGVQQRLVQLGINRELLTQALTGVAYQRLIPVKSGKMKALYDLWGFNDSSVVTDIGMTEKWEKYLKRGVKGGEISEDVFKQYKAG